jgi:hypothetical protein
LVRESQAESVRFQRYLELGMFVAAALVLEEIAPVDKTRTARASFSTWRPRSGTWPRRLQATL